MEGREKHKLKVGKKKTREGRRERSSSIREEGRKRQGRQAGR